MSVRELEDRFEVEVYPRRDIVIVRGEGALLYDEDGNEYIDCASNVGVSNIGHANPEVARAVHDQYLRLASCYGIFYNDVRAELSRRVVDITPKGLDRVFLCNSGSEAVEAAIKFARGSTGRKKIIAAMRGFHGKTMGALSATWDPKYTGPFEPMVPGFSHVPFNNIEMLKKTIGNDTAAVILEIVQGEGGVRVGDPAYFSGVRSICDEMGVLLIIDEVQTGFGRTGRMFACEGVVRPDILCLAKAMAGGVPMGAVVCAEDIDVPLKGHTSTFGGNPLACAAALATLDVIEREDLASAAAVKGERLKTGIRSFESPSIKEVRGAGLMIGIELKQNAGPYVKRLMENGIIALLAGKRVIRLLPPLVISEEQIDEVIRVLREVLE